MHGLQSGFALHLVNFQFSPRSVYFEHHEFGLRTNTATCDRQTDRQTQGPSIYRACIASRGKKYPGFG